MNSKDFKIIFFFLAEVLFLINQADAAAVILGGYDQERSNAVIGDVELYGCPGQNSIELEPLPIPTYLGGAVKLENEQSILFCGGYQVFNDTGRMTNKCYSYNAITNTWTPTLPLLQERYAFMLTNIDSMDDTEPDKLPTALGYHIDTEIQDMISNTWQPYR